MKPINDARKAEQAAANARHAAARETDKGTVIAGADEYLGVLVPKEKLGKRGGKLVCLDTARWNKILEARNKVVEKDEEKVIKAAAAEAIEAVRKAKGLTGAIVAVLYSDQDTDFSDPASTDVLVGKDAKALGLKCAKGDYAAAAKLDPVAMVKMQVIHRLQELASGRSYYYEAEPVAQMLGALLGREKLGFMHETQPGRATIIEKLCEALKIPKLLVPAAVLPPVKAQAAKAAKGGKAK